eukprot:gene25188-30741_t
MTQGEGIGMDRVMMHVVLLYAVTWSEMSHDVKDVTWSEMSHDVKDVMWHDMTHAVNDESLTRMLEEYMNRAEKAQGGTGGTSGSTNTPSSTAISQSSSRLECSETVAQRAARHDMSVVTNDFEHELK